MLALEYWTNELSQKTKRMGDRFRLHVAAPSSKTEAVIPNILDWKKNLRKLKNSVVLDKTGHCEVDVASHAETQIKFVARLEYKHKITGQLRNQSIVCFFVTIQHYNVFHGQAACSLLTELLSFHFSHDIPHTPNRIKTAPSNSNTWGKIPSKVCSRIMPTKRSAFWASDTNAGWINFTALQ